jgi:hypothetical protein
VPPFATLVALEGSVLEEAAQAKSCQLIFLPTLKHEKDSIHDMKVTPSGCVPILKLVGVLLKLKTIACSRHHFLQFIRQHLVQVFFEEPNGEMLAEDLFDYFRGNLALALLLLKVHLKILEACCDDLVRFIVIYEICYVLEDGLQK